MIELRRIAALAAVSVLAVACGGGGAASAGPTGADTSSQPTQAASSDLAGSQGPTDAPGKTAGPTQGGGGVGDADACSLLTATEAGSTLGKTGVTTDLTPGAFSYCMYRDPSGDILAASAYTARGGRASFDIWKASSGVQAVSGVGDEAVFDPSTATVFVIKGDALYSVTAGIGSDVEADRRAWGTALAKIAVGRI